MKILLEDFNAKLGRENIFKPTIGNESLHQDERLRWSRDSVLAFGAQVRGFKPGRSRRIFRAKKSSARLPSEGK
jgi:hypothetical protein